MGGLLLDGNRADLVQRLIPINVPQLSRALHTIVTARAS
jgi:hypothetical protein